MGLRCIVVDGRVIPVDISSDLWSSMGAFEGLQLLFPTLPSEETGLWTRRVYSRTADDEPAADEGIPISGTIDRQGRVDLNGADAEHITGQWSAMVEREAKIQIEGTGSWWIADGVLSTAKIQDIRTIVSQHDFDAGPVTVTQRHQMRLDVERREGCAAFDAPPVERADVSPED